MHTPRMVEDFAQRHPNFGAIIWRLSIQYYFVQWIVTIAWEVVPYSWFNNTISDLGNTACGFYGERFVCSPLHSLMNASFITLGIIMAVGALFVYQEFKKSYVSLAGFTFWAIAGFGTLLVGLFPENSVGYLHTIGAALAFFVGNLAMIVLGFSLNLPKSLRIYTLASGFIAMAALLLFVGGIYLGLGPGGMERLASYPQTLWLIVFGMYLARIHGKVAIGKGKLAGKGVFAKRNFKPGAVVIRYQLKPISQPQFAALPRAEKEFTHKHCGQRYLYSKPERYVNHSAKPNTYQDLKQQCDVALRTIKEGEPITTDATKDDIT